MEISAVLRERRERVFLMLAGFFLCAMTMLNIIGITRRGPRLHARGSALLLLMGSNYLFKLFVALADTLPFYLGVYYLRRFLRMTDGEPATHYSQEG